MTKFLLNETRSPFATLPEAHCKMECIAKTVEFQATIARGGGTGGDKMIAGGLIGDSTRSHAPA